MTKQNKLGFLLFVIILIGSILYFSYPYIKNKIEGKKEEDLITRITSFQIMDPAMDKESADSYQQAFNKRKDFFLANIGKEETFYALIDMGVYKEAVDDYKGAEEVWLYVREMVPVSYVVNGNLARLYHHNLNDYTKAEQFYLKALEPSDVINPYLYYNGLYELYRYKLNDQAKTEDILNQAMEKLPEDINTFLLAAGYYKDIGDIAKARELYDKALEINPDSLVAKKGLEDLNKQN